MRSSVGALACVALAALAPAGVAAQDAAQQVRQQLGTPVAIDTVGPMALSAAFRAAADRTMPAVVFIAIEATLPTAQRDQLEMLPEQFRDLFRLPREAQPRRGTGSGFIIDDRGHILTNTHVVADASRLTVRLVDGREYAAQVVGSDISTDVAVIRIEPRPGETLPIAPLGDSEALRVGDWVLALGNPLGLTFTVTAGIVSAQGRTMPGPTREPTNLESFIQTDAVINPGNSGGPLVDLAGRVVGVNTAIFGADRFVGYGFAVPIRLARRVADDLIAYGHLRRPQLGAEIRPVTAVDAEIYRLPEVRGALIAALNPPDGPAATAGLRAGDVVLSLDGQPVRDDTHLLASLAERRPGQTINLGVQRAGQAQQVNVRLGEFARPPAARAGAPAARDQPEQVLGFTVRDMTPADARRAEFTGQGGVVVAEVPQYGAAAEAGVRPNAIILAINGQRVSSAQQVRQVAAGITAGSAVSLLVHRQDVGEMVVNYRTRQ